MVTCTEKAMTKPSRQVTYAQNTSVSGSHRGCTAVGPGKLLPKEQGGCTSAPTWQTIAQAGWGCLAARKKKLLQAW